MSAKNTTYFFGGGSIIRYFPSRVEQPTNSFSHIYLDNENIFILKRILRMFSATSGEKYSSDILF